MVERVEVIVHREHVAGGGVESVERAMSAELDVYLGHVLCVAWRDERWIRFFWVKV